MVNKNMKNVSTFRLTMRLLLAIGLLFGLIYVLVTLIGYFLGFGGPIFFAFFAVVILLAQFLLGPKIVEMTMRVHYVSPEEAPALHNMVEDLALKAGVPKPKVGISEINIPNAFAFGRTRSDGRICVTRGILNILDEDELKAVLGHEMSHIRHRDMAVMTLVSAIPLICYYIFISTLFSGDSDEAGLIGLVALVAYLVGQLLVLFISRTREYYADQGSVELGNGPHHLASALYKLVYGSARGDKREIKEIEGVKAFFVNDISSAQNEISELQQVDLDMDGTISESELSELRYTKTRISVGSRLLEILSTHPNMVKRVQRLSEFS